MRFPDFLIIGAMKAGTTSLFFDLSANPGIFFPEDKEPNNLVTDAVLTVDGKNKYGKLFQEARRDQICGEASTSYSKWPAIRGVPERAARVLGEEVKIIYLVREPIARTISQHHHELASGTVHPNIDKAIRECPRLIDFSRYARQLDPWLERFGEERVHVVRFESYIEDRTGIVAELSAFLGVDPVLERVRAGRVYNQGDRMRAPRGPLWRFSRGYFYRAFLRPWLPRAVRSRLRDVLLPKAPRRPSPPSVATVDYILDRIREDVARLQQLLGLREPFWDLEAVRELYAKSARNNVRGNPQRSTDSVSSTIEPSP